MTTDDFPFRDPGLPPAARVDDLLRRLTSDERIAMLHQFAPAVHRLGLAAFRTGQEALHGVAWSGPATVFPQAVGLGASWDPDLVRRVGEAVGREVRAMRARDPRVGLNVWAPTVNLLRDPRWGRNEEGYAEDPQLTSDLATAFTRGLRGDHPDRWRTAPVLKHWLAHNHETRRDTTSSSVRPRVLHEYDLRAFRGPVEAGTAAGVMPAYNLVNGRPNHLSPLLSDHLRAWTGPLSGDDLVVCSDAGAPSNLAGSQRYFATHEEAVAAALRAGVDSFTDHDQDPAVITGRLRRALELGLADTEDVCSVVRRLLTMRLRLGEFDPDGGPFGPSSHDAAHDTPTHRALALEAAEGAVVLLSNGVPADGKSATAGTTAGGPAGEGATAAGSAGEDAAGRNAGGGGNAAGGGPAAGGGRSSSEGDAARGRPAAADGEPSSGRAAGEGEGGGRLLPLDAARVRSVAVVGLLADEVRTDWYSGTLIRRTSLLAAVRERLGADRVRFADGADRVRLRTGDGWVRVPGSPGGEAEDVGRASSAGSEVSLNPAHTAGRTDLPPLTVVPEVSRATELALADWGGGVITLRAPSGRYLTVAADGQVRAAAEQPGGWVVQETFRLVPHGDAHLLLHLGTGGHVTVAAGGLKVAGPDVADGTPFSVEYAARGADEVAAAAADADAVIVVAGNDPHINGRETEDRTTLALPAAQDSLWRAAHAANPRTVLALTSSYPYAVGEAAATLPALLWTAHGGQCAGTALARVLFGDVSPSGRLPQTWYAADADLPDLLDYDLISADATYLYFRGAPLFPFGHGLSYTSFAYRDLEVAVHPGAVADTGAGAGAGDGAWAEDGAGAGEGVGAGDGVVAVSVTVTNTGRATATETVQLYAREADPRVRRPQRALIAHRRLPLRPGESGAATFTVPVSRLGFWDVAHQRWTTDPGNYEIHAGASSTDIRLVRAFTLDGAPPAPRPVLRHGLAAADFDDQHGIVLVDRDRERGDAVTPGGAAGEPGLLVFRDCDFGEPPSAPRPLRIRLRAAHEEAATAATAGTGAASVELRLADGTALGSAAVPVTGSRYAYAEVDVDRPDPAEQPSGVRDLHVTLRGPVRLDRLDFGGR